MHVGALRNAVLYQMIVGRVNEFIYVTIPTDTYLEHRLPACFGNDIDIEIRVSHLHSKPLQLIANDPQI